ncbi:MAG: hypothetical protein A2511_01145 [Deltaproteobacteria bacterium RIFOXYD12_FULL_50_9]|nr:MAG: hypothetical protein A2511_01145 [Deltaproteobacteria bacterium RIFOXYD12_FULL_50_9]
MKDFKGFTLVEVAIVLVIVGLLLGGLMATLRQTTENAKRSETNALLAEAKEALIGFSMANGRLPCPADPTIATGAANAGSERVGCTLAADRAGALPWVTLGIAETDAWGRRFSYSVTPSFADDSSTTATFIPPATCIPAPNPTQSSFALCSDGDITIRNVEGGATSIAAGIPAVIISHGRNGFNAYLSTGTQIIDPSSGADENSNAINDAGTPAELVSTTPRDPDPSAVPPRTEYDDLVIWISPNILKSKMITAGKLP